LAIKPRIYQIFSNINCISDWFSGKILHKKIKLVKRVKRGNGEQGKRLKEIYHTHTELGI